MEYIVIANLQNLQKSWKDAIEEEMMITKIEILKKKMQSKTKLHCVLRKSSNYSFWIAFWLPIHDYNAKFLAEELCLAQLKSIFCLRYEEKCTKWKKFSKWYILGCQFVKVRTPPFQYVTENESDFKNVHENDFNV